MQRDGREPGEAFEAVRLVQIADQRRHARGAQRYAAFGVAGQRKDMGAVLQLFDAAHADIAATDDQHARPAQGSCRIHRARIVAAHGRRHRAARARVTDF